jgi:hypothetical protein
MSHTPETVGPVLISHDPQNIHLSPRFYFFTLRQFQNSRNGRDKHAPPSAKADKNGGRGLSEPQF